MTQTLTFSFDDTSVLASRAGIDEAFLERINRTVSDIRNLRAVHTVKRVVAILTSPSGEVFEIVVE
jgi:hypothetical protein